MKINMMVVLHYSTFMFQSVIKSISSSFHPFYIMTQQLFANTLKRRTEISYWHKYAYILTEALLAVIKFVNLCRNIFSCCR